MTDDPSETESDDDPTDGNGEDGPNSPTRISSETNGDPFDETFIVKETEEAVADPSVEDEDDDSTVGNSWLEESRIDESPSVSESDAAESAPIRSTDADDSDSDDWGRIPIDLDRTDEDEVDPEETGGAAEEEEDPHRPEPSSTPVVPGDPSLEGAVFVVLGAIAMLLVMFRLASLLMG